MVISGMLLGGGWALTCLPQRTPLDQTSSQHLSMAGKFSVRVTPSQPLPAGVAQDTALSKGLMTCLPHHVTWPVPTPC